MIDLSIVALPCLALRFFNFLCQRLWADCFMSVCHVSACGVAKLFFFKWKRFTPLVFCHIIGLYFEQRVVNLRAVTVSAISN